jgi:23S rRNA (adenine2030-N6)-methyltransferase
LLRARELPDSVRGYVDLVIRLGGDADRPGELHTYPGSPLLALEMLRANDRAALYEILPQAARELSRKVGRRRNVRVHCADGYAGLTAQLPPRERRGVVLIDPPYEDQAREFARVLAGLKGAHERWPTGVYALWYPIKRRAAIVHFHSQLKATGIRKILCAELCLYPDDSRVSLERSSMVSSIRLISRRARSTRFRHGARRLGAARHARRCFWLVPE